MTYKELKKYLKAKIKKYWPTFILERYISRNKVIEKNIDVAFETRKILLNNNEQKNIIIIHNLFTAPPTYGDFIWLLGLINILSDLNYNVKLFILCGTYNKKWDPLIESNLEQSFIEELIEMCNNIDKRIINLSSQVIYDINSISKDYIKNSLILCEKRVIRQLPIHNMYFDLITSLYSQSNLSTPSLNFKKLILKKFFNEIPKKYICLHARKNKKWGENRNISQQELEIILNELRKKTSLPIFIVSDMDGCNFFKKALRDSNFKNIFFSKDYTKNYYEDLHLIINSSLYLQFKGGGTSSIPIFYKIPYLIYCIIYSSNERKTSEMSICPWSIKYQFWIESNDLNKFIDDIKLLDDVFVNLENNNITN